MRTIFIFILISFITPVHAVNSRKCSDFLNNGLWKKYRYQGTGESLLNVCSNDTRRQGSSKVSSNSSTENSTTIVDTKYSSNTSTSHTQFISSYGDCSIFAMREQLKKDREVYIAQNKHEVLIDVARGSGEHLKVITFYSACEAAAYSELSQKLKTSFSQKSTIPDIKSICQDIDLIISQSRTLKQSCLTMN